MKIKYFIICLISLVASIQAMKSQTSDIDIFAQELSTNNASLTTIQSRFTQTRSMAVLQNDVEIKGNFYYSVPNSMLLDFDNGDYIKMTESHFEIKNGNKVSSTKITANPMLRNLSSVLNSCVSGNVQSMIKNYKTTIEQDAQTWTLTMQPLTSKSSRSTVIIITFNKKDMSLDKLKIIESNGDYIMYHFYNKVFNKPIDCNIYTK